MFAFGSPPIPHDGRCVWFARKEFEKFISLRARKSNRLSISVTTKASSNLHKPEQAHAVRGCFRSESIFCLSFDLNVQFLLHIHVGLTLFTGQRHVSLGQYPFWHLSDIS